MKTQSIRILPPEGKIMAREIIAVAELLEKVPVHYLELRVKLKSQEVAIVFEGMEIEIRLIPPEKEEV